MENVENKEIEIGYYARYYGKIYKVLNFYERNRHNDLCVQLGDFKTNEFCGEDYQSLMRVKENIIDLIEIGDYVNGHKVLDKIYDNHTKLWHLRLDTTNELIDNVVNTDIKSIVTKEEFESREYKVGE